MRSVATRARRPTEALHRYLVELHRPGAGWAELGQTAERARQVAGALRAAGTPVRFLRSVYVPEDDACFLLYEAPSEDLLREALGKAGLAASHVATTLPATESAQGEHAQEVSEPSP
jgi:hypothetical protein